MTMVKSKKRLHNFYHEKLHRTLYSFIVSFFDQYFTPQLHGVPNLTPPSSGPWEVSHGVGLGVIGHNELLRFIFCRTYFMYKIMFVSQLSKPYFISSINIFYRI